MLRYCSRGKAAESGRLRGLSEELVAVNWKLDDLFDCKVGSESVQGPSLELVSTVSSLTIASFPSGRRNSVRVTARLCRRKGDSEEKRRLPPRGASLEGGEARR